jgi:hypothetical protein
MVKSHKGSKWKRKGHSWYKLLVCVYRHLISHKENGDIKLQMYQNGWENQKKIWKLYDD